MIRYRRIVWELLQHTDDRTNITYSIYLVFLLWVWYGLTSGFVWKNWLCLGGREELFDTNYPPILLIDRCLRIWSATCIEISFPNRISFARFKFQVQYQLDQRHGSRKKENLINVVQYMKIFTLISIRLLFVGRRLFRTWLRGKTYKKIFSYYSNLLKINIVDDLIKNNDVFPAN